MNITSVNEILSLDIRSLAIFRVLLGIIVIFDTINRISLVPAFYSDSGIIPRELINLGSFENAYHFQILFLSGSEWFSYLILGSLLLFGFFLMIGYKTRLMTFLCWLLISAAVIRDPLTSHAADNLLIILLFWSLFLPLGSCFGKNKYKSELSNKNIFSIGTIALYVQVTLMYIMSGLFKAQGETWMDGSHLYLTLSRFDYLKPLSFFIYPYYDFLGFLTQITLVLELFGPLLLFIPFYFLIARYLFILMFLGLQLSIWATLDVGLFPLVSIAAILIFLPSHFWELLKETIKGSRLVDYLSEFANKFSNYRVQKESEQWSFNSYISHFLVGTLLVYVVLINLMQVTNLFIKIQPPQKLAYHLKLDQRWNMFAFASSHSEYLSAEIEYKNGVTEDLMKQLKNNYPFKDSFHHIGYVNYRWRIFFSNRLRFNDYKEEQRSFLEYLLRKNKIDIKNVSNFKLVGYRHYVGLNYNHSELERVIIYDLKQ